MNIPTFSESEIFLLGRAIFFGRLIDTVFDVKSRYSCIHTLTLILLILSFRPQIFYKTDQRWRDSL
jgi:hypothetical protein